MSERNWAKQVRYLFSIRRGIRERVPNVTFEPKKLAEQLCFLGGQVSTEFLVHYEDQISILDDSPVPFHDAVRFQKILSESLRYSLSGAIAGANGSSVNRSHGFEANRKRQVPAFECLSSHNLRHSTATGAPEAHEDNKPFRRGLCNAEILEPRVHCPANCRGD